MMRGVARLVSFGLASGMFFAPLVFADEMVLDLKEKGKVSLFGSLLTRLEGWDWFEAGADVENEYLDAFETARLGLKYNHPRFSWVVEGQATQFENLPGNAVAPAPRGALGTGATYFQHTGDRSATAFFVKHLYLDFHDVLSSRFQGLGFTLGRFPYQEGLETTTGNPKLDWLKRVRLSERLVGPFGWSAFQRSFNGAVVKLERPAFNWTALAVRPTQGGFEEKAGEIIDTIDLFAASLTAKLSNARGHAAPRISYLRHGDDRNVSQRVDNVATSAPKVDITLNTYTAELPITLPLGPGEADLFGWAAAQEGDWYGLDHRAFAFALEGGYQWLEIPWQPHVRTGWVYGSGDGKPGDGRHSTFFQILPTARKFAQFPFYNLMNSSDLFVQGFFKPAKKLGIRADWHWIELAERNDRWYSGAGATQERGQIFGFTGRTSQGERDLGHLVDVALTYTPNPKVTAYLYCGHVFGGDVVKSIYGESDANFAYCEIELKF